MFFVETQKSKIFKSAEISLKIFDFWILKNHRKIRYKIVLQNFQAQKH